MPIGRRRRTSSAEIVAGTISEYTRASRTRRAINCAYWAPKSTTSTVCSPTAKPPTTGPEGGSPVTGLPRAQRPRTPSPSGELALARGSPPPGGSSAALASPDHDLGLLEVLQRL